MIPGPLARILDKGVAHPRRGDVARGRSQTCKREELPTLVAKLSFPPPLDCLLIEELPSRHLSKQIARTSVKRELFEFFSTLYDIPPFFSKINPAAKSFAGRPEGEHEDGERFPRHGLRG